MVRGCLQLLCLARVVLNKSNVVIIDEVMSVINANTERILQRLLRSAFGDRTVINLSVFYLSFLCIIISYFSLNLHVINMNNEGA